MAHQEPVKTTVYSYTAVFEPDLEDGGYVVTFPAIPNLATQGDTIEEARAMAAVCLQGHLEALLEAGLPVPPGEDHAAPAIREEIRVELKTA